MRKTAIVVMLLLFVYNIAGYYLVFVVSLHVNAERIEHLRLCEENSAAIECIAIADHHAENIQWTGPDEFRRDGELFDVIKTETRRDTLVAYCVRDADEEAIDATIAEHVDRTTGDAPSHTATQSLPESPVKEFPVQEIILPKLFARAIFLQPVILAAVQSCAKPILTPPPRG